MLNEDSQRESRTRDCVALTSNREAREENADSEFGMKVRMRSAGLEPRSERGERGLGIRDESENALC